MDGSETRGGRRPPRLPPPRSGRRSRPPTRRAADIAARLGADDLRTQLLPVGQDGAFAASLARRFVTAGGIVRGLRAVDRRAPRRRASDEPPLAPDAGLAVALGHPLPHRPGADDPRQRPRRVRRRRRRRRRAAVPRPRAACPGPRSRALLAETAELLRRPAVGRRHPRLRAARAARRAAGGRARGAAAVRAHRRRPAVAGGPARGRRHRHLPARALARPARPVPEGRRPPVRVRGPRVRRPRRAPLELRPVGAADRAAARRARPRATSHVLFAGGIHDARSAAMVAALAAPLVGRGAARRRADGHRLPVHRGGGRRRRDHRRRSRQAVLGCERTVLLETSPGHATRCVDTAYVARSDAEHGRLPRPGSPSRRCGPSSSSSTSAGCASPPRASSARATSSSRSTTTSSAARACT